MILDAGGRPLRRVPGFVTAWRRDEPARERLVEACGFEAPTEPEEDEE